MLADGRDEEALEELDIRLGMVADPEEEAREALRAHQEASGMTFDNPDAQVLPFPGTGEQELPWPSS